MNTVEREQLAAGTQRVLDLLTDHRFYTSAEIEEVCEVTAHSRLSDLRAAGCVIEKRSNHGQTGRRKFSYRLIATGAQMAGLEEPEPLTLSPSDSGSSSVASGMTSLDEPEGGSTSRPSGSSSDDLQGLPGRVPPGPAGRDDVHIVPSGSFHEPDGLEDAGWRELFDGDSVDERVPPPGRSRRLAAAARWCRVRRAA